MHSVACNTRPHISIVDGLSHAVSAIGRNGRFLCQGLVVREWLGIHLLTRKLLECFCVGAGTESIPVV